MSRPTGAPLVIHLFGPFSAWAEGAALPRLRSRKGQWLLALLALRAGREVARDWLAAALWPDSPPSAAFASLRNSLLDLRRALGPQAGLLQSPTPYCLCLTRSGIEVDALAFDAAIASGETAALEHAVSLYRGPLLEGCVEEWAFAERQVREQTCLAALETLAEQARTVGDLTAAERCLRRAAAMDPLRESAQRGLMQVLISRGDDAAARRVYREFCRTLRREAHAEPGEETRALFQSLRRAHCADATTDGRSGAPEAAFADAYPAKPAPYRPRR